MGIAGVGDNQNQKHHNLMNFNFHFHVHLPHIHFPGQHHEKKHNNNNNNIPKGYLAILVGQGEEQEKFVIPVIYINHPLFMQLLKQAEDEYGFDQKGPITIPCHVEHFRTVQGIIDQDNNYNNSSTPPPHHHHHHHHHAWCFKV